MRPSSLLLIVTFIITPLSHASEELKDTDFQFFDFVDIDSQCYQKGQKPAEKQWLINQTSPDYYAEKFANETAYSSCVDSFKIAKHEVTVGLYKQFVADVNFKGIEDNSCYIVGENGWENSRAANWKEPSFEQSDDHPVVCVNYFEVQQFIAWLNNKLKPVNPYRLPTEAEWELAARGTSSQKDKWHYWGNDEKSDRACSFVNISDQSLHQHKEQDMYFECNDGAIHTNRVNSLTPNGFGLYQVLGNVQEYTCSGFSDKQSKLENECDTTTQTDHVTVKGGAWYYPPIFTRGAFRGALPRNLRFYGVGFRLAQSNK